MSFTVNHVLLMTIGFSVLEKRLTKNLKICEGDQGSIDCRVGSHVNIISAKWGRDDNVTCAVNTGCNVMTIVTSQIKTICQGQGNRHCDIIHVSEASFGSPCPGLGTGYVYILRIEYNCTDCLSNLPVANCIDTIPQPNCLSKSECRKCMDGYNISYGQCIKTSNIDRCTSNPCVHGTCTANNNNNYQCVCNPGYTGTNCQNYIDQCNVNPCVHGTCTANNSSYQCMCNPGYTGTNCQNDISQCNSNPCVHGTCTAKNNSYKCVCNPGYTGTNCQNVIDECVSNPCIYGNCINGISSYRCVCNSGYTGTNCNTDIDECSSSPCINGTCLDSVNRYTCQCSPGFRGPLCDQSDRPVFTNINNDKDKEDKEKSDYVVPVAVSLSLLLLLLTVLTILYFTKFKKPEVEPDDKMIDVMRHYNEPHSDQEQALIDKEENMSNLLSFRKTETENAEIPTV